MRQEVKCNYYSENRALELFKQEPTSLELRLSVNLMQFFMMAQLRSQSKMSYKNLLRMSMIKKLAVCCWYKY